MNCPTCKSDRTQSIKMMCLSGTTTGKSIAMGMSSGLNAGLAAIDSRAQTSLAANYNPGVKPVSTCVGVGIFFWAMGAFFILMGCITPDGHSFGFLCGFASIAYGFIAYNSKTQKNKISEWERKTEVFGTDWICHKCGRTWTP